MHHMLPLSLGRPYRWHGTTQVGQAITTLPEDFHPHKRIKKVYDERRKMIETGEGVDWGMAEALAFGTLLAEGAFVPVSN